MLSFMYVVEQARSWEGDLGGGGGGAMPPPQLEIELKSCPTKTKFALVDFSYFHRSYKYPGYFKMAMSFFKKKTINLDILICRGSYVDMCTANKVFVCG